ncbi:iron ABC transporter permease [candidate division KSB3 bacterium]|uniref:Iron ABC transporter permease n=1 Tax=candidate division KSB3 bacterium TaxID=2044937 RepID=A0A2G6E5K6_9BACT|nr:MAG: iron ABC transporter permease [candidate division KSB3 bacterium]PIE29888.1 MAG: iron ABC transporter permease [candidate division KSB3 bacterium]
MLTRLGHQKGQTMLFGSVLTLLLLSFLPFSSQQGSVFAVLRHGNFSAGIWAFLWEMPVLGLLMLLVLLNGVISAIRGNVRKYPVLQFAVNFLAVLLFIIQFVFVRPDIPLGAGAWLLFFTLLLFWAQGFSRLGYIMGDTFISGSILSISALLLVFIVFPLIVMLGRSVIVDGRFAPANLLSTLQAYPSTWRILKNSLYMASSVGLLSTAIGLAFALVIERSRFRYKRFMQGFSLLPIITPPFVIGLAIIFMLGRTGYLSYGIFNVRSSFIFGFPGIVLAQTLSFAPMAYLILSGVVRSLDSTLEEASYTMGADRWYTLRRVIWPLIRPGVANAFLISVIESLADFANPILLGGDFDVLSTSIYLAIIGRYDEVLAASLGLVLLSITLTTFLVQRYWVGKRSYVTITGKPARRAALPLPKTLDYSLVGVSILWIVLTVSLYGSVFLGGFVKLWGVNNTLTLMHYKRFLVDGFESYTTTIKLAALSAPLTAIVGLLIAYLVSRYHFFGKDIFEFTSMLSFAIPGTVVGIGYVMSFNTAPLLFTGTASILVICFIFRNMPVGIRSAMAALQQIDRSLEESSITLGASNLRTFHKIVLPLIRPAIFSGLVFSFVRAMTAISAVIFLVTARTKLATTVILGRIEAGKLGLATAYCTLMIFTMIAAIVLMHTIVRKMTGVGKPQTIS